VEYGGQHKMKWVGNDQQEYSVKSGYSVLNKEELIQDSGIFQLLWSLKIAPSVTVFAWRILLDRLPTRANLARREGQVGNVWCPMCQEGIETTQHLFTTCKVTQKVWDLCDRWVGNVTVGHNVITAHFQSFRLLSQSQRVNKVWKGMWVATVSEIWNHINNVVFKGGVVDHEEIFSLAQLKGWLWLKHKSSGTSFSYSDWYLSPVRCLQSLV